MDKELAIVLVSIVSIFFVIVGLVFIGIYASWWASLGVFMFTWGNNIGQRVLNGF
jgi:hypothetical protein